MGPPGLAAVVIGDRPDSLLYVRRKVKLVKRWASRFHLERLPGDADQDMVVNVLRKQFRRPFSWHYVTASCACTP